MEGLAVTRATLRILPGLLAGIAADRDALRRGFSPGVFATDRALELVAEGVPFRDAYHEVKAHLDELESRSPEEAVAKKTHLGAPMGLDFARLASRIREAAEWAKSERAASDRAAKKLWALGR